MPAISDLSDAMLTAGVPAGFILRYAGTNITVAYTPETTQGQKDIGDALVAAFNPSEVLSLRKIAMIMLDSAGDSSGLFLLLRSFAGVLTDEMNLLRQRLVDQDAAVANATSLADLKARWATVASNDPMPQRTLSQARIALKNKANSGAVDN